MPTPWAAPAATGPVVATVRLPGSKSITNRALVLAALADAPSTLHGALLARDTRLMMAGLAAMGTGVVAAGTAVDVLPRELTGPATVDCGLAGTVMRFLPTVAALAAGEVRFDGDERARRRPLAPLTEALRRLGVDVEGDALPLTVRGTGTVRGGEVTLDSSTSSQFVSALLLVAPLFEQGLELRHRGDPIPSLPHIDMTVAMLRSAGISVTADTADPTACTWQVAPGIPHGGHLAIEPDLSNAGPFLAAAMVTGGAVTIPDWPRSTTQAGDHLRGIFTEMGGRTTMTDEGLRLEGPERPAGVALDLSSVGELVPTVAAVAAFADGPTELRGIGHLRGHETDRLRALTAELRRLGCGAEETADALRITPGPMHAATLDCYDDHRMATFGAVIGLLVPGVILSDVATTDKTLPDFPALWSAMAGGG